MINKSMLRLSTGAMVILFHCSALAGNDNIALGKPYTFSMKPNYSYCTDAGDLTQLTDGKLTSGYFWTQKSTVGWGRKSDYVTITIDLGKVLPIGGASFRTAAGTAGVSWPMAIAVMTSNDGIDFHYAGDLVTLSAKHSTPPVEYGIHIYSSNDLKANGRFVRFLLAPSCHYVFCDEIEVFRGEDDLLNVNMGDSVTETRVLTMIRLARRFNDDINSLKTKISKEELPLKEKNRLQASVLDLEKRMVDGTRDVQGISRATIPLNDWHKQLIAVQGELWRLKQLKPITVWSVNQWDMVDFWGDPPMGTDNSSIHVEMMRNETRSAAFNVVSSLKTDNDINISYKVTNGEKNLPAEALQMYKVEWTDTADGILTAAALVSLEDKLSFLAVPGMIRQIWISIDSSLLSAGTWQGRIELSDGVYKTSIPIDIKVHPMDFPEKQSLHVGGWDYTNVESGRGVTPENRLSLIAHLKNKNVDTPWATSAVMPRGSYDAQGNMTVEPSTKGFDEWLSLWPGAANYAVFLSVKDTFAGSKMGTSLFEKKVESWISWWVTYLKSKHVDPSRLIVLLVDEPRNKEMDLRIISWAKMIKAAEPDIVIWEDPCHLTWADKNYDLESRQDMFAASDVLCALRPSFLKSEKYQNLFDNLEPGQELWFYSCAGPSSTLDPYSYYRLQAWQCVQVGAKGSCFWSFSSSGRWNEYINGGVRYNPLFMDKDSVTSAKQMEAVAESVEDYEYFVMLKKAADAARSLPEKKAAVEVADQLLNDAADSVLNATGACDLNWEDKKDRSLADKVRIEVLRVLAKLQ